MLVGSGFVIDWIKHCPDLIRSRRLSPRKDDTFYRGTMLPLLSERIISTRRFNCRPPALSLLATGNASPYPPANAAIFSSKLVSLTLRC